MARACVIVLDAVGAGELPDAASYGDEGSNTLGNVAHAVGGLDLPNIEALGLGNVMPLEGCPPQPGAPAVAGRLVELSAGKDTTTGHWEHMGIVTPTSFPTYPHGFPDEVIDPFMNQTGRGVLGNKPASGTEIIQELGEEHQRTGKWIVYTSADSVFQIAAHEETIPLEELYDNCRVARDLLTGRHAVGRVIARPFAGEPGNYRAPRTGTTLAQPPSAQLSTRSGRRAARSTGSARSGTSSRARTSTTRGRRSPTSRGSTRPSSSCRRSPTGFVFVNLVETDMLWGHRNDPVNFHRCLQDFDRRLPDILEALRTEDLLILTSDHGCDPTTPSTDHSRETRSSSRTRRGRTPPGASTRKGSSRTSARRSTPGSAGSRRVAGCPGGRSSCSRGMIRAADLIERKRNGAELSQGEIEELVLGFTRGEIPDYQMAAWCMAVYFKGLSGRETHSLTDAMIRVGRDARPGRGARPEGRRQALDRGRG